VERPLRLVHLLLIHVGTTDTSGVEGAGRQDLLDPSRQGGKAWAGMSIGQLSAAQLVLQTGLQLP